ncbi:hypothetical protein Q6350_12055 [Isoptericola sp. b515]|uniref:hypothetical protein n=1 Tax=Isoptericola sp. b515 TaxID=3064652 RepID=UPI002712284B|nr:hypothetical protein [Isoptericola sp. b515]MDO8149163.1 hypothetical protein [Isoptericola sp. b515]
MPEPIVTDTQPQGLEEKVYLPTAPLLTHFVGRPRGPGAGGQAPPAVQALPAEQMLSNIVLGALIRGFYVSGSGNSRVVCASDISPAELRWAFHQGLNTRGRYEPWAVVLDRTAMWQAGMRPVLYVEDEMENQFRQSTGEIRGPEWAALVVRTSLGQTGRSDWTHEREWRYCFQGDSTNPSLDIRTAVKAVVTGTRGWKPNRTSVFDPEVNLTYSPNYSFERWFWNGSRLVKDGTVTVATPSQDEEDEEERRRQDEDDRLLREHLGLE